METGRHGAPAGALLDLGGRCSPLPGDRVREVATASASEAIEALMPVVPG